ncbi:hypothetical protein H6763_00640 [Candidatus Nomurabacteria bacterium]|nr:hypothetical protein [Candidatus Nomurabacteria bacterium]MCB9803321.1 hypothetical protein [Candidatus Nomurabacteria bacterium]
MSNSYSEHLFILGRNKALSIAEIKAVASWACKGGFESYETECGDLVVQHQLSSKEIVEVFRRLGGSIKIAEILAETFDITSLLTEKVKKFGVSPYICRNERDDQLTDLAKKLRKNIKEHAKHIGKRVRYIGKGTGALSSGQITATELLEEGFELILYKNVDGTLKLARTLAVQDLEEFTLRDMEKPYTNIEMGVLPPKLARIMVNLAGLKPGSTIWDPFCGSGSIVIESLLLGYDVIGSDIDPEAVEGTQKNIEWLSKQYDLGDVRYKLLEQDVTKISRWFQKTLRNTDINAVVFEPYMGPAVRREISLKYANELLDGVNGLYKAILDVLGRIRKPGLRLVSVFPVYKSHKGWVTLRYSEVFPSRWKIFSVASEQEVLHWERSNSIIRRNLLVARLKH